MKFARLKFPWKVAIALGLTIVFVNILSISLSPSSEKNKEDFINLMPKIKRHNDEKGTTTVPTTKPKYNIRNEIRPRLKALRSIKHLNKEETQRALIQNRKIIQKLKQKVDIQAQKRFSDVAYLKKEENTRKDIVENISMFEKNCTAIHNKYKANVNVPLWQKKVKLCKYERRGHFYLTFVTFVRIHAENKAKWTVPQLEQWIHYIFWMGVEHLYLCDAHEHDSERLEKHLKKYIDKGMITYLPFTREGTVSKIKTECYQYVLDDYSHLSMWQGALDMDEYPVIMKDPTEGSLIKYIKNLDNFTTEISLHNYIMLGKGDKTKSLTIEQFTKMTYKKMSGMDKPIYRPYRVQAGLHHNKMLGGNRIEGDDAEIRVLQYWGDRPGKFGHNMSEMVETSIPFNLMRKSVAPHIKTSIATFAQKNVFSIAKAPPPKQVKKNAAPPKKKLEVKSRPKRELDSTKMTEIKPNKNGNPKTANAMKGNLPTQQQNTLSKLLSNTEAKDKRKLTKVEAKKISESNSVSKQTKMVISSSNSTPKVHANVPANTVVIKNEKPSNTSTKKNSPKRTDTNPVTKLLPPTELTRRELRASKYLAP